MGQGYFQFKQFNVRQGFAAMKVCTDACIMGAYVSKQIPLGSSKKVLDIGTGTGLLSMMYAQNNSASIDAIEIDPSAAWQAKENFAASPWHTQLHAICADINHWTEEKKYNLIISNPPFYEASLKSPDERRNKALHGATLSLQQLLRCISKYLSPGGRAALLLPAVREAEFKQAIVPFQFFGEKVLHIYQRNGGPLFRFIVILCKEEVIPVYDSFTIYETDKSYTTQFKNLLREYYLKM